MFDKHSKFRIDMQEIFDQNIVFKIKVTDVSILILLQSHWTSF